jgi:carbamate kinase
VPNVYINYGEENQQALGKISAHEIEDLKKYGYFKSGSMLPKVEAAITFAKKGGTGIITDIDHLEQALAGLAGTIITK